jgi:hypothetical protein
MRYQREWYLMIDFSYITTRVDFFIQFYLENSKLVFTFVKTFGQMAEDVEKVELGFWDSLVKLNEKLTLIILKAKSQMDISDEDYELIKPLFGCIWGGQITFLVPKVQPSVETAVEQGLFADNAGEEPAKELTA